MTLHSWSDGRVCGDAGGRTKDGSPCRAFLNLSDAGFCAQHDERRAAKLAQLAEARAAFKEKRKPKPLASRAPAKSLEEIAQAQSAVTNHTLTQAMDARTSEAATKSLRNEQLIYEKLSMQNEIKRLTAELAAVRQSRSG